VPDEQPGFLKSVFSAFAVVTAWVFVVGWAYLHTFFQFFGINTASLDFPVYHYCVFCFTQFVAFSSSGIALGILLLLLVLITWAGVQTTRKALAVAIGCGYLIIFWAGFHLATEHARTKAISVMGLDSPQPHILLEFEAVRTFQHDDLAKMLGSPDLRLLLETNDQLYVFVPVNTSDPHFSINVATIDRHQTPFSMRITKVQEK